MTATAGVTLRLAAIYNVLFGAICVLRSNHQGIRCSGSASA